MSTGRRSGRALDSVERRVTLERRGGSGRSIKISTACIYSADRDRTGRPLVGLTGRLRRPELAGLATDRPMPTPLLCSPPPTRTSTRKPSQGCPRTNVTPRLPSSQCPDVTSRTGDALGPPASVGMPTPSPKVACRVLPRRPVLVPHCQRTYLSAHAEDAQVVGACLERRDLDVYMGVVTVASFVSDSNPARGRIGPRTALGLRKPACQGRNRADLERLGR